MTGASHKDRDLDQAGELTKSHMHRQLNYWLISTSVSLLSTKKREWERMKKAAWKGTDFSQRDVDILLWLGSALTLVKFPLKILLDVHRLLNENLCLFSGFFIKWLPQLPLPLPCFLSPPCSPRACAPSLSASDERRWPELGGYCVYPFSSILISIWRISQTRLFMASLLNRIRSGFFLFLFTVSDVQFISIFVAPFPCFWLKLYSQSWYHIILLSWDQYLKKNSWDKKLDS